jgi:hypothetical protein
MKMLTIAALLCLLCASGAIWFAIAVLRTTTSSALASIPVDRDSTVTFDSPGEIVVEVETPRLSQEFRLFEIAIINAATGEATKFAYHFNPVGAQSHGVTTMKVPFGRMFAPAGQYFVRIANVSTDADHSNTRVILSRPYMGRLAAQIVALVLCAVGALGSVI